MRGAYLIKFAWLARGNGRASTVSEEGWRKFHDRLGRAGKDLEKAHELAPQYPHASALLITVAMGLSEDSKPYFERAIKIRPGFLPAYERRAIHLAPKWGGSVEALRDLAREALADGSDPALGVAAFRVHQELAGHAGHDPRGHFSQESVREQLEAALGRTLEAYPHSSTALTLRAELRLYNGDGRGRMADLVRAAQVDPFERDALGTRFRLAVWREF